MAGMESQITIDVLHPLSIRFYSVKNSFLLKMQLIIDIFSRIVIV